MDTRISMKIKESTVANLLLRTSKAEGWIDWKLEPTGTHGVCGQTGPAGEDVTVTGGCYASVEKNNI